MPVTFRLDHPHAPHHPPHGVDDVRRVEVARGHLVEHRREQQVVLAADQDHREVRLIRQRPLEPPRRIETAEAAAHNDHAARRAPGWRAGVDLRQAFFKCSSHDRFSIIRRHAARYGCGSIGGRGGCIGRGGGCNRLHRRENRGACRALRRTRRRLRRRGRRARAAPPVPNGAAGALRLRAVAGQRPGGPFCGFVGARNPSLGAMPPGPSFPASAIRGR
jgi:hypothetical protein